MIRTFMDVPANGMTYKSIVEAFTGFPFEQLIDSFERPCLFPFCLAPAQAQLVLNAMLFKDSKRVSCVLDSVVIDGSIKSFFVSRFS